MNLKKWTLLVVMIGVLLATAFANDGNEIIKKRADFIKERKAYFKENIKPKIDAQRNKLETSISADDKKEIVKLRDEIMNQRLLQNEFIFNARASRIKGEEVDDDLMTEISVQRIVIENLYDKAKIIANKYRPEIDDLLAELREDGKEWRDQMRPGQDEFYGRHQFKGRRGMEQNLPGSIGSCFGSMSPRSFRHMDKGSGHGFSGGGSSFGIAAFLLWDVNKG